MVVPFVSTHCYAVIGSKALVSARWYELFSLSAEKLNQIHRIGLELLFLSKVDVGHRFSSLFPPLPHPPMIGNLSHRCKLFLLLDTIQSRISLFMGQERIMIVLFQESTSITDSSLVLRGHRACGPLQFSFPRFSSVAFGQLQIACRRERGEESAPGRCSPYDTTGG